MTSFRASALLRCFLRSYLIIAAGNSGGLQNIGFMYAMDPALAALYGQGQRLKEARLRYVHRYNSHPFFTPMLLGVFVRLEADIAARRLDPAILMSVKDATTNALSALGDSFFNGTLLVSWSLSASCLILAGLPEAALWYTVACFAALQIFKFTTFVMGLRKGMAVLRFLRRLNLINWGEHCKHCNAALLGCFLWLAMPGSPALVLGGVSLYLMLAGWIVGRLHFPRVFAAMILLALAALLHFSGLFGQMPALFS